METPRYRRIGVSAYRRVGVSAYGRRGVDGPHDGGAKNSAHFGHRLLKMVIRAGFEPFCVLASPIGLPQTQRVQDGPLSLATPSPQRGSKPARLNTEPIDVLGAPSFSPYHRGTSPHRPIRPFAYSPTPPHAH
jgi:hypothetical protein